MRLKTTTIIHGWGLRQENGWMRHYRSNDCTGFMRGQLAMWPTRKQAKAMSVPGERPEKVRAMYMSG